MSWCHQAASHHHDHWNQVCKIHDIIWQHLGQMLYHLNASRVLRHLYRPEDPNYVKFQGSDVNFGVSLHRKTLQISDDRRSIWSSDKILQGSHCIFSMGSWQVIFLSADVPPPSTSSRARYIQDFYLPNSQNYVFLHSACIKYRRNLCSNTLTIPDLSRAVRQWDMSSLAQGEPGPSITNVFATRRKNFSQWHRSFQRKLLSHWLKFLRHVAITLVIQGPGPHLLTSRSQNAIKIS